MFYIAELLTYYVIASLLFVEHQQFSLLLLCQHFKTQRDVWLDTKTIKPMAIQLYEAKEQFNMPNPDALWQDARNSMIYTKSYSAS